MKDCPACGGKGTVPGRRVYPGNGAWRVPEECGACAGTGRVRLYPSRRYRGGREGRPG